MSGLEVAVAVAGIVSGFGASVTLFQQWRAKVKKRREANGEGSEKEKTQAVLDQSGPLVQKEYDGGFRLLGEKFAKGDEIGRSEIQTYLITLQQSIITLLSDALRGNTTELSLAKLFQSSNSVRNGSIRALTSQFQRMAIAETHLTSQQLTTPTSRIAKERSRIYQQYCPFALRLQKSGIAPHPRDLACPDCPWGAPGFPPTNVRGETRPPGVAIGIPLEYEMTARKSSGPNSSWLAPHRFFWKCHLQMWVGVHEVVRGRNDPIWGCLLCDARGKLVSFSKFGDFGWHLRHEHGEEEYREEIDIEERYD